MFDNKNILITGGTGSFGRKYTEIICPDNDSHLTFEFDDHFVIQPTIQFTQNPDFSINKLGEKGIPIEQGFKYRKSRNDRDQ